MSENEDSFDEDEMGEFVSVVVARSPEEAEMYRVLLDDHDIPAILATDEGLEELAEDGRTILQGAVSHGTPVLVPESLLDEASQVISEREDFQDLELGSDEEEEEEEEEDDLQELGELTELDDETGEEDFDPSAEEPFDAAGDFYDDTDDPDDPDDEIPDFGS